jgi:signal transduction histidine kinase
MANTAPFPRSRFRAELILGAAIVAISLLVLAFAIAVRAEHPLRARTLATINYARIVRDETLAITQTMALADAARSRQDDYERARAHRDIDGHIQALREASGADAEAQALIDRIEAILYADFGSTAPVDTHLRLRAAVGDFVALVNARNDSARSAENHARNRLDMISAALSVLSLTAAALAILALRRERNQWRLANELAESARAKATASDLAKTRFLAVASHDMRQPLHALTLYISALQRRVESAEARDILAKMERATNSMVSMFATLLDLARIQAGVVNPDVRAFPLQDVLDRIVAENPGGSVEAAPTSLIIRSDPILVERILRNLVSNAIKHGGGHARIEVSDDKSGATVSVVDDGPGIPEEDRERIFEEFVRLDSAKGGEGLGLGLSIVKRIADILGAELSLASPAGGGAKFSLRLTTTSGEVRLGAPQNRGGGLPLLDIPILVIDDDTFARSAMSGALRDLGADVCDGGSEADGEAILTNGFAPRMMIMDLRIDGQLQGIDIATRLRAKLSPPPQVFVITGDTAPETLALLRASGFAWLIKPVDPERLTTMLASAAHP